MTAQTPERLIVDGRPCAMYSLPLERFLSSRRLNVFREGGEYFSTSCWRCYRGTWQVIGGRLHLVHLNTMWADDGPLPPDLRARILRAVPATDFPVFAN